MADQPARSRGAKPSIRQRSGSSPVTKKSTPNCLGQWPTGSARAGSTGAPPGRSGFPLGRPDRQREERAVREFQVPTEYLHLAFAAAFAFDHEFGAHRKPTGKTARSVRHGNLLQRRHPGTSMCRSIDPLHGADFYPRYPQRRTLPCARRPHLAATYLTW
jgi:hypothetical protein